MHKDEPEQDKFEMGKLRIILTVQAVLTMYLFYISFYSDKNEIWDQCGFWIHTIVALLTYFCLPVAIIVVICLNAKDSFDTAMGPSLCATGIANLLIAIYALI